MLSESRVVIGDKMLVTTKIYTMNFDPCLVVVEPAVITPESLPSKLLPPKLNPTWRVLLYKFALLLERPSFENDFHILEKMFFLRFG